MEPLRLKPRQPVEEDEIENWDDDDFLVDGDDLALRSPGSATNAPSRRRDSNSSHLSLRSEFDSVQGEDEKQVHIPGDDEKSTLDAITAAEKAGIPLPKNVPSSALTGGTIKRLGGRKIRRIIQEDWEHDLELPDHPQGFKIKQPDHNKFPATLRQVSGGSLQSSPSKMAKLAPAVLADERRESLQSNTSVLSAAINLDKFKDNDDDDDFFGDSGETIKISKSRQPPKPISLITPPTPQKAKEALDDDFEKDLELPSDGKLKLSMRREIPKTPLAQPDDLDWGEGSLGTRFGGTRRDGRSNRSSSASALSPSVSSSFTAESEDETFEGLVLPVGPVNFQERLQKRRKSRSPQRICEEPIVPQKKSPPAEADRPDFLEGLELGEGDVFDSGKLTLHRNIKVKETRPASPARPKATVSLTFTNKPVTQTTRIPRLNHERSHSTSLEPVSESGGPITTHSSRRSLSRMGHSSQPSTTSLPTPTSSSSPSSIFAPPVTRRRELGFRTSTTSLRTEPTTTSAQLLKQKRSLPGIRPANSPAKPPIPFRYERPSSRGETGRPSSSGRKTPVERPRPATMDSAAANARKSQMPFLPAGASQSQSQHVSSKTLRHFRRHDSDNAIDLRPRSRTFSRATMRSPSPQRYKLATDTWERLSKPKNKKNFGDGHELDGFDDLPTSKETETKFLKQPITSGPKSSLRNKGFQNILPDRTYTPAFVSAAPQTPAKSGQTPHFARDTAASRIAREASIAQRTPSNGPLAALTAQRVAQLSARPNPSHQSHHTPSRSKRHPKRPQQLKPHLISNLNTGKESKSKFLQ